MAGKGQLDGKQTADRPGADDAPALERALAADRLAVLELRTEAEAITTRATLTQIREQAEARRRGR